MARISIPFGTKRISKRDKLRQLRGSRVNTTLLGVVKNEEEVYVEGSECDEHQPKSANALHLPAGNIK